jgi:hypothetical protein
MTTILHRLALILALCVPSALLAQSQGGSPNSRIVIFIHAGGGEINDNQIRDIAVALVRKQYTVRVPDRDQDKVGGPGVDYFDDSARAAAEDVANTVNAALKGLKLLTDEKDEKRALKPRRQFLRNPPGYLGVWLF